MNKNTKLFLFGAITMLVVLWFIGCDLAADQAAGEEEWYTMVKCECAGIGSFLLYWIYVDLDSFASLRRDLNEARSRIRELEEKHAQEVEKCENNRA